jgi:hypothetical protein
VFFNPAASSVLPSIVDDDELVAANSGLWSAAVISQIALAPLAGAVVAAVGVSPAFLVNAPSFAVSALLLAGLRLPGRPAPAQAGSWLGRVGEGARLLVADRPLLLRGVVDLVLASTRSLVAMGALAVYGVGTSTGMVTYNSLLQAEVAPEVRGRVFAGFDLLWQAGRLASLVLGGIAADALGIRAVYYLGGVLLLVAGVIGFAGLPPSTIRHGNGEPAAR